MKNIIIYLTPIFVIMFVSCGRDKYYRIDNVEVKFWSPSGKFDHDCVILENHHRNDPFIGLSIKLDKVYYGNYAPFTSGVEPGLDGTLDKIVSFSITAFNDSLTKNITDQFKIDSSLINISPESLNLKGYSYSGGNPCQLEYPFLSINDFIDSINNNDDRSKGTNLTDPVILWASIPDIHKYNIKVKIMIRSKGDLKVYETVY